MAERLSVVAPRVDRAALEAAEWFERLASAPAGSAAYVDFVGWRDADPENAAAFAAVKSAMRLAGEAREDDAIWALRRETSRRVALAGRRRRPARMAIAASIFAVFGLSGMAAWNAFYATPPGEVYQTAAGERTTVALSDGSTMTLNTRSRVRTEYSRRERRLVLEAGEAIFEVAKGQPRPFIVVAGGQAVTAHGTVFDVRLDARKLDVALLEGSISVKPEADRNGQGTRVRPGQRLRVASGAITLTDMPKVEQLASWRSGIVIFEDTTLAEAVSEMNRYGRQPIRIGDAALADLRLSGSFRVDNPETFLEALQIYFPVVASRTGDGSVVLQARSGAQYAAAGNF